MEPLRQLLAGSPSGGAAARRQIMGELLAHAPVGADRAARLAAAHADMAAFLARNLAAVLPQTAALVDCMI